MKIKPTVLVTSPSHTQSGYGQHSRDIIHSLIKMDKYDIKLWPVRWGNTSQNALNIQNPKDKLIIDRILKEPKLETQPFLHIHIVIPNEFSPIGKYNIGITAGTESTICPPSWIEGLNKMDYIIVPSKFTKNTLANIEFTKKADKNGLPVGPILKCNKQIDVLFEGVDTNLYKKTTDISKTLANELSDIKENFIFLFVGHWLQGNLGEDRKDVGMLIKVFFETFKNKSNTPALLLKTSSGPLSIIDKESIQQKIYSIRKNIKAETLPNIYLLYGDLTDTEMNELYNWPKIKAMVNLTHGEGYGRPLAEFSAASGKPIITSNWGGQIDFLSKDLSILLPGSLIDVPKSGLPDGVWMEQSKWFCVNYQQASLSLKNIFYHYRKYILNAKKQQKIIRGMFSLDAMTNKLSVLLKNKLPKTEEIVTLKLPKLKKIGNIKESNMENSKTFNKLPTLKRI